MTRGDLRPAHERERAVGMEYYVSDADGVGGRLRDRPEEFVVREREAVESVGVDADPGSYPYLVVRARLHDWDTNDFARALSDRLEMSRERVSWAGTKDRRAVTTQLFSLQGVDAGAVPDLPGAEVEVVGRLGRPVLFGDLWGNEFEVTVAEPDAPERAGAVTADLAAFATGGLGADGGEVTGDRGGSDDPTTVAVPNYFGIQRFGSLRPVTHEVGLAVVREDWEAAVLAYVGAPDDREPADTREARAYAAETRDWRGALERFPRRLDHERAMLAALAEGESFRTALERVPTNLQRLFVHAAQSFAFNRIVSERLDRGLPLTRPVAGDVVAFVDRSAPDLAVPDTDRLQRVETGQLDRVARHCERGRAFVTGPLVGTDTDLADGEPGELVRSVLSDLELAPGAFDLPGEFDSTGDRRALAVRTDLRVGREPLRFSFALPPGSYATTLLREYLKCDPTQL